jgi:hypothetical protein
MRGKVLQCGYKWIEERCSMETFKEWKFLVLLFLVVLCAFDSTFGVDDKSANAKKKLQIGVKKRVDNCQVKSKKGDFLHMHYKVR